MKLRGNTVSCKSFLSSLPNQKYKIITKHNDDTDAGKLKSLIENVGIDKLNLLLNDLSKVEKISPKQTKKRK